MKGYYTCIAAVTEVSNSMEYNNDVSVRFHQPFHTLKSVNVNLGQM